MVSNHFNPNSIGSQKIAQSYGASKTVNSFNLPKHTNPGVTASITAADNALAMVYQAAMDKINDLLHAELGEGGLESVAHLDHSPEATADRILSLSTGFFEAFKQQHPGEDEQDLVTKFVDTISQGIDQGFREAREILEGLQVLEGKIATDIDLTYEYVQQGLDAFLQQNL